ncbi:hypothetical protein TRFO_20034 [Tritrichomonas foetus]|uniref:RRM domain-containing protein n=1 Tax=Tritrichomonas foetus TaxID=1144522 RepID=A0A1J4KGM1_9EUKA|nr:hypothetical protein TRFO_20034 [Tritrichomonas foetus]|eukprot:OHT10551.1 hypothetical protein TRFO_20034 [Tritrichomonas foetus]
MSAADRRTLFVQNLPASVNRTNIWDAFVIFGEIANVKLSENKDNCIVEFEEEGDANAALDNMHLSELFGQTIYVSFATKGNLVDRRKPIWDIEFDAGEV